MKKILVISTSLRKGGNSDALARQFVIGAKEAGNDVEYISLADKVIAFCRGCLACQKTQKCVIADDAVAICEKMRTADAIVWATPVYYYSVSGQMKTMIDRANALYPSDYHFRDIYLLPSAAEDEPSTIDGAKKALESWISCYEKVSVRCSHSD